MTDSGIKTGGNDTVTSNVYDDDDLIDYDDDEIEPTKADEGTKAEEIESRPALDVNDEPNDTIAVNSVSFTKLTDFDRDPSIPDTATTYEKTTLAEPANGVDEIDYDDEENAGGDVNSRSAPAEHDEQAAHQEQEDTTYKHDQDDDEIDFGIVEDNTTLDHDVAGDATGHQNEPATAGNQQDQLATAREEVLFGDEEHNDDEGNALAAIDASASTDVDASNALVDQSHNLSHNSQANAAENDEITWEETEDQVATGDNAPHGDQQTAGNAGSEESIPQEAAQSFVAGEQLELGDHIYEEADNADDHEFPAITVQYKGEEFPLFSITSEGFFTSTTVLDENVGSLLAGFRKELANEIASEDELVFQVDELGLEYAESHSQDTLGHVTLNQILEIFDLLVKNQDPDSERALYTYLFTKPSTTKRFESLIESAAAGTGLDQVMYHFDSPVPHGTNPDGELGTSSYHDLDEYQSPSDAHDESTGDQQEYDYIDDLEDTTKADGNTSNVGHGGQYGEAEADELQVPGEPLQSSGEENLTANLAQPVADAEANGNTTRILCHPPTSINSSARFNSTAAYPYPRVDNSSVISDFDITLSQKDADENVPALAEADFEMAMEPNLDDTTGDGNFNVDEDLTSEYRDEALDLANAGTSASNTIDNDDTGLDMTAEEAAEALDQFDEAKAPDLVDDEIDWREDPADEDISTMSASAVKRSHDTDGLDQEDEPEPKRQRS